MIKRLSVTCLAVLLMTSLALAQPGQGRGRGGPGGGFGFGRGGFGGFGGSYMGLVRMEPVQTELKVTEDQKSKVDKLAEEQRTQRDQNGPGRGTFQDFQNLSDEERRERFEQFRKEAAEREKKSREQLAGILDEAQMKRLKEISIQLQGTQALNDEEVAKELALTDLQKEEIADTREDAVREMREQMGDLFQPGGDPQAARTKMQELRKQTEEKVLANLTDEQKKQFEAMKGAKFEMPEGAFGFGGRGQGGPGGGRRPGGDGAGGDGGGRRRPGGDGGNGDGGNRPRRPDSV